MFFKQNSHMIACATLPPQNFKAQKTARTYHGLALLPSAAVRSLFTPLSGSGPVKKIMEVLLATMVGRIYDVKI